MNKWTGSLARIFIILLLLVAGGSFPVTAGSALSKPGGSVKVSSQTVGSSTLDPYQIFLPLVAKDYYPSAPLWRFGAAISRNPLSAYESAGLVTMRFGWYVDFTVNVTNPTPFGMEYVPTVRVKQLKKNPVDQSITNCYVGPYYVTPYDTAILGVNYTAYPAISQIPGLTEAHPGLTWLIGNEMDRIDSQSPSSGKCNRQDEMVPELYAQVYHDYYWAIKSSDPTAQVAIGGLTEFTPLRQQYLQRVWNEYLTLYHETMPVDVWNIHLYILREEKNGWGADIPAGFDRNNSSVQSQGILYDGLDVKNFSLAWAQILSLRTWMKTHDQQNKPLIITEYGVLFPDSALCDGYPVTTGCPFTAAQVRDSFMYPSFDKFLNYTDANLGYPSDQNRLVQRWNWFSIDFDSVYCVIYNDGYEYSTLTLGGALFNSGKNITPCSPNDHLPPLGMTELGMYYMQYVQNLPSAPNKPYAP